MIDTAKLRERVEACIEHDATEIGGTTVLLEVADVRFLLAALERGEKDAEELELWRKLHKLRAVGRAVMSRTKPGELNEEQLDQALVLLRQESEIEKQIAALSPSAGEGEAR